MKAIPNSISSEKDEELNDKTMNDLLNELGNRRSTFSENEKIMYELFKKAYKKIDLLEKH